MVFRAGAQECARTNSGIQKQGNTYKEQQNSRRLNSYDTKERTKH